MKTTRSLLPHGKPLTLAAGVVSLILLTALYCGALGSWPEIASFLGTAAVGMAVTANQLIVRQDGCKQSYPVAATIRIYQGTLCYVDSSGYLTDTDNNGANKFAGIAIAEQDNSSGSNGDLDAEVWQDGVFELVGSGFTQGTVGSDLYGTDNYTVQTSSTNASYVGRAVGYVSSTKVLAKIVTANDDPGDNLIAVPDAATYTVLAAHSGKTHVVPDLTADTVISLPAVAAGLAYDFIYGGVAADAQDWQFDTGSDANFYLGGLTHLDSDAGSAGDEVVPVAPDGNSNSKLNVLVPDVGTHVRLLCDGTNWYLTGQVVGATAPTFADQ